MQTFGLIGKSLSHSFSKEYFTEKFQALDIEARYENFELDSASELNALLSKRPEIKGLNITIPFKTEIIPFLDRIESEAEKIGAVNTIVFEEGKTTGFNTDLYGFSHSLKPFLKAGMDKALVLGTGGASLAVAYALRKIGLDVLFVSRNPSGGDQVAYSDLNKNALVFYKLIINTTPLGTAPNTDECPPLPYEHLNGSHLLYDLVYNPSETTFLRKGKEQGASAINGMSMLKMQAEKSWELWNA